MCNRKSYSSLENRWYRVKLLEKMIRYIRVKKGQSVKPLTKCSSKSTID